MWLGSERGDAFHFNTSYKCFKRNVSGVLKEREINSSLGEVQEHNGRSGLGIQPLK